MSPTTERPQDAASWDERSVDGGAEMARESGN